MPIAVTPDFSLVPAGATQIVSVDTADVVGLYGNHEGSTTLFSVLIIDVLERSPCHYLLVAV